MNTGATTYYANGHNHNNWILENAEWVSRKLCYPFALAARDVIDLTEKWEPGAHRQFDTYVTEMLNRAYLTVAFMARFTIGLGLWVIGNLISSITHIARKDFTFVRPENQAVIVPGIGQTRFNVLTYNVCLGPEWMVAANKLRPTSERVHEVAATVRNSNCDIVCLQEVFDEETAEILKEKLQAIGYTHFVYNAGPSCWKLNSGLFIASKYPLSNPTYWKFEASSGWDAYSGKGTLAVTVRIGEQEFALFTTHLNGYASEEEQARREQMNEFLDHIEKYMEDNGLGDELIGCGDFNEVSLSQVCPRFDRRFANLPIYNEEGTLFDVENNPIVGRNNSQIHRWTLVKGAIDHIFTSTSRRWIRPGHTYASRAGGASDHLSVASSFFISHRAPSKLLTR